MAPHNQKSIIMLKKRVKDLINRYETGEDGWLSSLDVREELEEILSEEPYEDELSAPLYDAINEYVLSAHYADRDGGRTSDGGDEFIERVKQIIGYENEA